MNYSKADKEFNVLKFAEKQLLAKKLEPIENGFIINDTYSPATDGFTIYPKEMTGAVRDEIADDRFIEINPKHQSYMRYGATQFLMLIYGLNKEQAKNKALKLIRNDYEEKVEQEGPQYQLNKSGSKLKIYENLAILLNSYAIKVRFNELTRKVEIEGIINVQDSYDASITKLNTLCQVNEFNINKDKQYDFMYCVAMDNRFNSVVEYLERCKEKYLHNTPSEPVINQLFKSITYTSNDDLEFNNRILLKVLLGAIHLAYNKGNSFVDFLIVLHGKQGIGKTQWIKSLVPTKHLNEFFKEGVILNLKDKDSLIENTGYWIIELGEFGKTLKENDRDQLKTFIGKAIDEYRSPYARTAMKHPRHTVMIATVNDDEFFRDTTGNRRFVVFEVLKLNFQHGIDIDLLWGELMLMYEDGKISTFLSEEEQKIIMEKNKRYMVKSTEQIILEEYIPFDQPADQWKPVTSMALAQYIEYETGRKLDPRRIGKALNTMGYEAKNIRLGGIRGRYYTLPYIKDVSMPF